MKNILIIFCNLVSQFCDLATLCKKLLKIIINNSYLIGISPSILPLLIFSKEIDSPVTVTVAKSKMAIANKNS